MSQTKHAHVSGTGGEYRLVLDREAINVFKVNRLIVGTTGDRALPIVFGAYRPVQALANAINQYMAPVAEPVPPTPQDLLRRAIQAGATLSDFLQVDSQENPSSDEDLALIEHARECYHCDGDLEFDNLCVVSGGDDPSGDYVLCWKWVYRQ